MIESFSLNVNGKTRTITTDGESPLLYILRNDFALNGPKFGCGLAQCGACAVLANGIEIRSCVTPISQVGERKIVTAEGLGTVEHPSSLQAAFIVEQAAQCGYCTSGMTIAATALLKQHPKPNHAQIVAGMDGHLCRCGTYLRIASAIERASKGSVHE
ncbi:MAG TPA: (2Fe-2S)-binding protein [Candidatus Acidoferrales bacterium]|nr:(2Fe-2S)-binding protein [Candidatus Acidoferrales bacterium]